MKANAFTSADRRRMKLREKETASPPMFSLLISIPDYDEKELRRTLQSLERQWYSHWQVLLATPLVNFSRIELLVSSFRRLPKRTEWLPMAETADAGLNSLLEEVRGDFFTMVDAGDQLADAALACLAGAALDHPHSDMIYSDEDSWNAEKGRHRPFFKPDWSPEYFEASAYTGKLSAYRTSACRQLGGFRDDRMDPQAGSLCHPELKNEQEWDLAKRLTENRGDKHIVHIPNVLYHRRLHSSRGLSDASKKRRERAKRFFEASLKNDEASLNGSADRSKISIIIPTAGKSTTIRGEKTSLLLNCLNSIREKSTYPHFEVVVIDNGDLDEATQQQLQALDVRRVTYPRAGNPGVAFNLADKINFGAAQATGDYLVLLNDDTEVITPDWLECMLAYASRPGVGAVGAKLLFPDGRLQHVGVSILGGGPNHPFHGFPGDHPGYFGSAETPRNYLAVTGACLMTPREMYERLGGFDVVFPMNYNDVDYCLRLRTQGLRIVYAPDARLYHFESASREGGATVRPEELERYQARWGRSPVDPYHREWELVMAQSEIVRV